jgi:hypothetical protein
MKTTAIFIFLALIILPSAGLVLYIISILIAKRFKNLDTLFAPSPKLQRFRSRRRLFYSVVSIYLFFVIATLFWAFFLFISDLGWPSKTIIFLITFTLCMFAILSTATLLWCRYIFKRNPVPENGFTPKTRIEWYNKLYKIYTRNLMRVLFYIIGFSLVVVLLFALIAYYFG